MNVVTLRTLTFKSKLGFGKYKNMTVIEMIGAKQHKHLTSSYYKLSKINFSEEVLLALNISEEFRMKKPSTDLTKYNEFILFQYGKKERPNKDLQRMFKETKVPSKEYLKIINQNK